MEVGFLDGDGSCGWKWGSCIEVGGPRQRWWSRTEAQELLPSRTQPPFSVWGREGSLVLVSSSRGHIQSLGTGRNGEGPGWHSLGGVRVGAGGGRAPVPLSPVRFGSGQDPAAPSGKAPGAVSLAQLGSSCP